MILNARILFGCSKTRLRVQGWIVDDPIAHLNGMSSDTNLSRALSSFPLRVGLIIHWRA
jgi:hypothetical protein